MAPRICLVGGSGFVGTAIAALLDARGEDFSIFDRKTSPTFPHRWVSGDITRAADLGQIAGDCLIHLAAVHRDDVRPVTEYDRVNVEGTRLLCEAAERKGITRILFASSVAVYGMPDSVADERTELAPFNDYGRTKAGAEKVLLDWQARDPRRRSLIIIRPTVIFGPGNRGNVFNLFRQIARRRFVMIGDGTNRKSMAYLDNVAHFFVRFIDAPAGVLTVNYVDEPALDMNALVSLVRGHLFNRPDVGLRIPVSVGSALGSVADAAAYLTGRRLPISRVRVRKFVSNTVFRSIRSEVNDFIRPITLDDAIRHTLDTEFVNPIPGRPVFFTE